MNIFITGAYGFVGRNLTEYLTRTVEYTLFAPKSSELDLLNEKTVDEYVASHKIDVIIHGANHGVGRDADAIRGDALAKKTAIAKKL